MKHDSELVSSIIQSPNLDHLNGKPMEDAVRDFLQGGAGLLLPALISRFRYVLDVTSENFCVYPAVATLLDHRVTQTLSLTTYAGILAAAKEYVLTKVFTLSTYIYTDCFHCRCQFVVEIKFKSN